MGMEDIITKMAMREFTKELKDPNSLVSKKFNDLLYGNKKNGTPGLFEQYLKEDMYSPSKAAEQSEQAIQADLERYKRTTGQAVIDNILPAVGTALKGTGGAVNAYKSLLGDALLAVSQGLGSEGFDNPFVMGNAAGLGKKATGAIANIGLNAAGDIATGISKDIKNEREKEKETELLLRERPSGQFYDSRKQLTKNR